MKGYTNIKDTNIELHKLYKFENVSQFIRLNGIRGTFPVPTEFVVTEQKICSPLQGRWMTTKLFLPKEFTHKQEYDEYISVVEVFEDRGEDGHTDPCIEGYAFFKEEQLRKFEQVAARREFSNPYGRRISMFDLIGSQLYSWYSDICKPEWLV